MMHLDAITKVPVLMGSQPITTADLIILKRELGTPMVVACIHIIIWVRDRFGNLHTRTLYVIRCPLCASYQIVSNPVDYVNACNQPLIMQMFISCTNSLDKYVYMC